METHQDQEHKDFVDQLFKHLTHEVKEGEQKKTVEFSITPISHMPSPKCYRLCYRDPQTHNPKCVVICPGNPDIH